MRKEPFFVIAFIIIHAVSALSLSYCQPQENDSLIALIDEALKVNPEILAARRAYEAANARIWQAASLSDPVVEFEYDKMTADRMLSGNPMKTYAISQEVPFPTKLFLRARIAAKFARMAYENYKSKERKIVSEVKSVYAELFLINKTTEIEKENKRILEQFSGVATSRYSLGRATQADALKAQVDLARVENRLIILEQNRLTAQARMNILLNRDPGEEVAPPAPGSPVNFTRPIEDFYAAAKGNNPELKAYRYAIDRGKAAYDLSLNEFMPDIMVKFSQMVKRDRVDENMWAGMLGVTVPLWFFQKQAFGVKEMSSELEAIRAEYKTAENTVLFDIRDSYARAEANKKLIELYLTSFIPQAEQTVNAALKGYESEKTDFLTLLDSQRMFTEFQIEYYKAILEFRIALADLERAAGKNIDDLIM